MSAPDPNQLLTELEAAKNQFSPGHSAQIQKLLTQLSQLQLSNPHHLIRFHEALLFLRAFPQAPALIPRVEHLLNTFHQRIEKLTTANADMSAFDDFDTSGIAATTMQDVLSFEVAQWLTSRIPRNIEIAWDDYWDDYQAERSRGNTWPRFIPLLEEDAYAEANIPWKSWLDQARGRQNPLPWLLHQFAKLPLPAHQQAELYDSLRLPVRWKLENLKLSRTRNFVHPRRFYFHNSPLIQRSEVSLAHELSQPAPKLEKLSRSAGESLLQSVRDVMFVRYRELYGTTLGDPTTVVRADVGRGVVIHLWGLPAPRRLPLRAYLCGYTLKNGVPIHYFEAIGLCEWLEVGFNVFYTYRQGETAWIYAQTLRCLRALTAATCISIYPYQIGQDNDEAIDSGAFWFYRKLGFRSGRADLQKLCEREEKKIAANPQYRSSRHTLKRLAEAHMFYDVAGGEISVSGHALRRAASATLWNSALTNATLGNELRRNATLGKGTTSSRAVNATKFLPASAAEAPGSWDAFSTRTLGLRINHRMSQEFNGDSHKIRQASTTAVTRALTLNPSRWTPTQKQALENWSLVLAQIPNLTRWTLDEKRQLIKIIQAKSAPNEMSYLHQTQNHPRLRKGLLRLGSKA
jgi:hypothetical protein